MCYLPRRYATVKTYAPILNTKDFDQVFGGENRNSLSLDAQNLLRALETTALPGTKIEIIQEVKESIVEIKTSEYAYTGPFFMDLRFLLPQEKEPISRVCKLPSIPAILKTLQTLVGMQYIWGGNCPSIPEMLTFYPPKNPLEDSIKNIWTLSGFDCSGLIYYATNGFTPRNTSSWISWGKGIPIEGLLIDQILPLLQPLDALVWKGHVIFILDSLHTIESRVGHGVVLYKIKQRLEEILYQEQRKPKNAWEEQRPCFLMRRWHPDLLT